MPRGRPRARHALQPAPLAALAGFGAAVATVAVYGSRFSPADAAVRRWYRTLDKPPFNPPDAVFAPVWTTLYTLIALSGWRVWRRRASRARTEALALWALQLGVNGLWSKLFFGKRRPALALVDIVGLLSLVGGYVASARRVDRVAARMLTPYLAWVAFATVLNAEIVRRNQ